MEDPLPRTEIAVIVMDGKGKVLLGRSGEGVDKDKLTVPIGYLLPFESMSDAASRLVFEWARRDVKPKDVLFICEAIDRRKEYHRIVIFVFADPLGGELGEDTPMWVSLNDLGEYQDQMSDIAVDGFYKLSIVLKSHAGKVNIQPAQA